MIKTRKMNLLFLLYNMDIFNLPQDICKEAKENTDGLFFHHYLAPTGSFKGKSILHKNAISLVISGTKTMHFSEKTVQVKDDEFHFLSAGNCIVTMDLPKARPFESVLLFFDNKILSDFHRKYHPKIAAIGKKNKIESEAYIAYKKDDFVKNYIDSLKLLFKSSPLISTEMKLLKFEELLLHLLEKYPSRLLAFPLYKKKDLEDLEIRKAVEANIFNHIGLEELAFLCNLSLSTFKRRFQSIYGSAPSKWLLQKRMEWAKELISKNGERPGEVYHKVGYENHSSFSQSFKQYFGVAPKVFMEDQQTGHAEAGAPAKT